MNLETISLVGLGKLGLPLSLLFANNNQNIIAYDIDVEKIQTLKENKLPFFEPQLEEYFQQGCHNISFDTDLASIPEKSDVAIILVNTPSNENGEFSNQYVLDAVTKISTALKKSTKKDFLFIISSTVMPTTHEQITKEIESKSGRELNKNVGLLYIPDLVALGSVIHDFENPDLLILGQSDEKYGKVGEILYKKIIKNNCPIIPMTLIESEITKVSLNAYITMKISYANFIGNLCEKYNCISENITKALGFDKRISPYYIKSGLAFGGTCFPRDTWAFIKMSENVGLDASHIKATQKINTFQNELLFEKVQKYKNKKIGVLGLSFKPNTTITNESPGYILYMRLKETPIFSVFGCDELVQTDYTFENIEDFLSVCDVIVLTHNNLEAISKIKDKLKEKILINPWNLKIF